MVILICTCTFRGVPSKFHDTCDICEHGIIISYCGARVRVRRCVPSSPRPATQWFAFIVRHVGSSESSLPVFHMYASGFSRFPIGRLPQSFLPRQSSRATAAVTFLTLTEKKKKKRSTRASKIHRLYIWRWSFSGVRELRGNFKIQFTFQQLNRLNPGLRSWKSTYLDELDVNKPLVESISQKSGEPRLNNLF
jgi:hypothetical protein